MLNIKYCSGCRNNFYNGNNNLGVSQCWSRKDGKVVWRIRIGNFERPPYKNRKKIRVASCQQSESCGDHFIKTEALTKDGYWR
jgi:hypothetical protein